MAGILVAPNLRLQPAVRLLRAPFVPLLLLVVLCSPAMAAGDESCTAEGTCSGSRTGTDQPLPGLPSTDEATGTGRTTTSLADQMGPMVINEDGTMKRIANWGEMTEVERANTIRVISKRNAKRIETLKKAREEMVNALSAAAIIPDVIADVDDTPLRSTFISYTGPDSTRIELENGIELSQELSAQEPVVSWPGPAAGSADTDSSFMTVIMLDPDAPSRGAPQFRNWLHWLVVDVQNFGGDIISIGLDQPKGGDGGKEIASYKGPTPPKGTGLHRYVFLLFRHTTRIADTMDTTLEQNRASFNLREFTEATGLGAPSSVMFFTCQSQ